MLTEHDATQGEAKVAPRKLGLVGIVIACVAAFAVTTGIMSREKSSADLRTWTDEQAVPTVAVIAPSSTALNPTLELPGRLEAYSRAPIYARVSGYVKGWYVDIGAKVKAGQLLADIEAPDLDQQLVQARADLASQQASAELSAATLERRKTLLSSNFVSKQEIDERTADLANKRAAVKSGEANVSRLEALTGFKKIVAPFDGVVTARNTDVGALINAGASTGPAMFVVSDIKKLRVYVDVPQSYVPMIKIGAKADITMPGYADRTFPATVETSSQSVDASTGTTRMQLALDNSSGQLMPGSYANVRMSLDRGTAPLHIPASALIFNRDGLRVATVSAEDRIVFKPVVIARDLGKDIELASGLAANDRVVIAPPDGIVDGDKVRVSGQDKARKPATASRAQDEKS
ncbi:MAG: efflux RND transporter periplasmic adaptor subunit [Rhizobiales bacterium]|nr:efflux RND transporter periplasmic adaptor subunit [Hyphomicrobiales bacterium]